MTSPPPHPTLCILCLSQEPVKFEGIKTQEGRMCGGGERGGWVNGRQPEDSLK
jgi:hypothetical protein